MEIGKFAAKATAGAVAGVLMASPLAYANAGEDVTSRYKDAWNQSVVYAYSMLSNDNKSVSVRDDKRDTHAVYTEYDRLNNHGLRLDNNGGEGTTKTSGSDARSYVRKVTACVNVAGMPDECGPADRPGDGD